ncbi:exosporium protein D [Bacillus cereus group sp. TH43LC]|uniref:exosporium protein D n=1 Tax=Bacillus TaxID=1386 RepID=UPI000BAFC827|nr:MULTISPECIES: exosporium protein D [Bacillus cereus group]ASZ17868.1 exosporium protein D [Bacillus cereus]MCU4903205.1 exosporium protein D [Bacillus paranthracis]MDA1500156.1 exosporium protein D [Bacillus cereus group sp. TH43LC]MDA1787122.1 exosporium protein D [Bacillus cereus group sp. BY5-1LC]MDA1862994.1 exosporium protein D [Bacillus cereus group sp. BY128LC]
MADYFYKNSKKCYKKHSKSNPQNGNCSIETHTIAGVRENSNGNIPLIIDLLNTTPQTVFEDFTNNHNKTLIQLFVVGMSAPVDVTILTRGSNRPITTTLQPVQTKIFQVEDFQSLILTKHEGPASAVSLFAQKTFCICCNNQDDSCDGYYSKYDDYY